MKGGLDILKEVTYRMFPMKQFLVLSFIVFSLAANLCASENPSSIAQSQLANRILSDGKLDLSFSDQRLQPKKGNFFLVCSLNREDQIQANLVLRYRVSPPEGKGKKGVWNDVLIAKDIFIYVSSSLYIDLRQALFYSQDLSSDMLGLLESMSILKVDYFTEKGIPWLNTWLETDSGVIIWENGKAAGQFYLAID